MGSNRVGLVQSLCQTIAGLISIPNLLSRRVLKKPKEAAWGACPWEMSGGGVMALASRLFRRISRASVGCGFCGFWCTDVVPDLITQVSRRSGGGRWESFKEEL